MSARYGKGLRAFALFIVVVLSAFKSYGSHIFGVDLYYTHVAGNTFTVNLVIYGDCSGSAFSLLSSSAPIVHLYNGGTLISDLNLSVQTPSSGVEVTPVCAADAANTTCVSLSGTLPGIKKFVYSTNVTLSGTSSVWRFLFTGQMGGGSSAGRSNSITNITIPGTAGSLIQLVDTLNNTTYNNSSAIYNTIPTPFFCINTPANFNPAAVDADGDSLAFFLVPGIDANTGSSVSYIASYTAIAPLQTTAGAFSFSSSTGQMAFTPNATQKSLVVYNVEEYHAGVLRGTSQREMSVVVLSPCTNSPPSGTITGATAGTAASSTQFNICNAIDTYSFHINPTDPEGDTITMTVSGLPAGATFTILNNTTPAPLGTFKWYAAGLAPGNYTFYINYTDKGCPLAGTQTLAYTITILPMPTEAYVPISPATCIKKAVFTVTPGGPFSPYIIDILSGSSSLATITAVTGTITDSLSPGTYTIRTYNPDVCYVDTTFTIAAPVYPKPAVTTAPPLCPGGATGSATITATLGTAPYQYAIGAGAWSASGVFTGLAPGSYTLHIKDVNGCTKDTIVTVPNATPLLMHINIQRPLCNSFANGIVTLSGYNSVAPYTYSPGSGVFSPSNVFNGLSAGTYTFSVQNANGCIADTTLTLTDSEKVHAALVISPVLCNGGDATVTVNGIGGFGPPYTYAYDAGAFDPANIFTLPAGTYTIHVLDPQSCFFDTSITLAQPAPLVPSATVTNVSCNGGADGTVSVTATGSTPGYLYDIAGGAFVGSGLFTGLPAGTEIVQAQDANGCVAAYTVTLTQPSPLLLTGTSSTIPSCYGGANGTFTINASGGTPPYTYSSDGITYAATDVLTGLAAGNYFLYAKDANGCIKDTLEILGQPPAIVPSAIVKKATCSTLANGSVTLSASGGTPGYQYAVGAGAYNTTGIFSPLAPGSYIFHTLDGNGCIKDTTIIVGDSLYISGIFAITPALCYAQASGSITVNGAGGTAPYNYSIGGGAYSAVDVYTALPQGSYNIHVKDANGCIDDTTVAVGQPTNIVPAITITQPSCYNYTNGSITVAAGGGTPAYTFSFDNSAFTASTAYTGLPAGTDSVTIQDANGCLHDTVFTISQPTQLVISSLSGTNISCNGGADGAATVLAAGGTPPYMYGANASPYQLSGLLTGLAAGIQDIHVKDNNGCIIDTTLVLTQPMVLAFTGADTVNPTCQGYKDGSVIVHAAGGTIPYTYSINDTTFGSSNAFPGLPEGMYTFYVTDAHGCSADTSVALTGLPHILIDNISVTAPTCYGAKNGAVVLTASGGVPPLSYKEAGDSITAAAGIFDNLFSGSITIVITDSRNCFRDTLVAIPQPDSLTILTTITPNECVGYDTRGGVVTTIVGGTAPFSYLWNTDPPQTTAGITGLGNGAYTVWVKDAYDCQDSVTTQVTYDDCCSPFIPDAFTPNNDGNNDIFKILFKGDMKIIVFSVYNRFGQVVYTLANTADLNQGWDGKLYGTPAEMGTYYYFAKLICGNKGDHIIELKGDITLVR